MPAGFFLIMVAAMAMQAGAAEIPDPPDDAATVEYERFFAVSAEDSARASDEEFNRVSAQVFFPLGKPFGRELFGGLRGELLDRIFRQGEAPLNADPVQRYAVFLGLEVLETQDQEGFFFASGAYNGDFDPGASEGFGSEWSYSHFFKVGPRLKWGVGIDLMQYLGEWRPYPLLFLEWWMFSATKLRVNADVAEARQFFGGDFCLTLGTRYGWSYGALGRLGTFEYEFLAGEAGVEYRVAPGFYLRVKYKELYWGDGELVPAAGKASSPLAGAGRSIRVAGAFAL